MSSLPTSKPVGIELKPYVGRFHDPVDPETLARTFGLIPDNLLRVVKETDGKELIVNHVLNAVLEAIHDDGLTGKPLFTETYFQSITDDGTELGKLAAGTIIGLNVGKWVDCKVMTVKEHSIRLFVIDRTK